jgi:hypothetical protein
MGQRAGDDGADIVEQSGRYALIRDADGVAIYDLDVGSDADPVASYPPGDEGFEAAWERDGCRWWLWFQVADTISYHVGVGALAVLLVLWLWQRSGNEAGGATAPRRPDAADRGSGPDAP